MQTVDVTALPADDGKRADVVVALYCGMTRTAAQRLLDEGGVLVNGAPAAKGRKIVAGDVLAVTLERVAASASTQLGATPLFAAMAASAAFLNASDNSRALRVPSAAMVS